MANKNYIPYGPEWQEEMMKFNKPSLIGLLKKAYQEKNELQKHVVEDNPYLYAISIEKGRAEKKHPNWPTDILHQIAIVNEEAGEATRAVLHLIEGKGDLGDVWKELVQTAAMCLRMMENLRYTNGGHQPKTNNPKPTTQNP